MNTERNAKQVEFDSVGRRKLVAAFDGEHISSVLDLDGDRRPDSRHTGGLFLPPLLRQLLLPVALHLRGRLPVVRQVETILGKRGSEMLGTHWRCKTEKLRDRLFPRAAAIPPSVTTSVTGAVEFRQHPETFSWRSRARCPGPAR